MSQSSRTNTGEDSQVTGFVAFHKWLAAFESQVKVQVKPVRLTPQEATAKLTAGLPLLSWKNLEPDWPLLHKCLNEVLLVLARHLPALTKGMKDARSKAQHLPLVQRVVRACYEGHSLPSLASGRRLERRTLRLAGQAVLRPFLCAQQEKLLPLVDQEQWRRGTCPVCGGLPDLASLSREQGARRLVCSRCDTQWLFHRLQCPYCENQGQDTLSYLTDEEGFYRLYLCDECHSYLRAVDLRKKEMNIDPPRQRVEMLDLDRQARLKGYKGWQTLLSLWS